MRNVTLILGLSLLVSIHQAAFGQATQKVFNEVQAAAKVADTIRQIAPDTAKIFVWEFRGVGEKFVGLSKLIGESLVQKGVKIERDAQVQVEGRLFRFPIDANKPIEGYTIRCTVVLADGSPRNFSVDVDNVDEAHIATASTGEQAASPDAPGDSQPESGIVLTGNVIHPGPHSPYGVELLVERGSGYQSLRPTVSDKSVSVKVRKGDIIAVRLHNRSKFDAAASVFVDGLSRFALADKPERRGGLDLVGSQQTRDIKGYFRDEKSVDAFRIGEYSKSEAAKLLPAADERGTFTIAFRAAWKKGENPPPNELKKKSLGVEAGPKREDPTETVEREIGAVRAIVKVFYAE